VLTIRDQPCLAVSVLSRAMEADVKRHLSIGVGLILICALWSTVGRANHLDDREFADIMALSCNQLYNLRNQFFHEKGLCFTRPEAVRIFGNVGCKYKSSDDLPMTARETKLMKIWVQIERDKGCPRR
jgi:hypothetical protein